MFVCKDRSCSDILFSTKGSTLPLSLPFCLYFKSFFTVAIPPVRKVGEEDVEEDVDLGDLGSRLPTLFLTEK